MTNKVIENYYNKKLLLWVFDIPYTNFSDSNFHKKQNNFDAWKIAYAKVLSDIISALKSTHIFLHLKTNKIYIAKM